MAVTISSVVSSPSTAMVRPLSHLAGHPLGDLQLLSEVAGSVNISKVNQAIAGSETKVLHTPASIVFVRNRMFYARAALNAQGGVRFGLRHIRMLLQSSQVSNWPY